MPHWAMHELSWDMRESQQALELRKFFVPGENLDSHAVNSFNASLNYDGALDAFAETLLWRLNAVRAMVSLIDRGTQYFLAGVVRITSNNIPQNIVDDVVSTGQNWYGCTSVSASGGLCENTVALDLDASKYPCFIVGDLSQDPRFANIEFVDGRIASFRFYAGAPIVTSYGVTIGSLFIFDNVAREGLTLQQKKFMHQQASNVMKHLETKREAAERQRGALMSQGLARFLEKASRENDPCVNFNSVMNETISEHDSSKASDIESCTGRCELSTEQDISKENFDTYTTILNKIDATLNRGAETLRESMELESGGVVFLDTSVSYTDLEEMEDIEIAKKDKVIFTKNVGQQSVLPGASNIDDKQSPKIHGHRRQSSTGGRRASGKRKSPKVLAMSVAKNITWDHEVTAMDTQALQDLTKSYPKGNVWYIDKDGYFSSMEQLGRLHQARAADSSRSGLRVISFDLSAQRAEATMLSQIFFKARQIVFVPLWDASTDRWYAGCFLWSRATVPVFTFESEIAFLSAFTNSMMVEISRLDVISSDKTKSDFISSISHEFRSPLHGIIASAEFLRDSALDASQHEFISTIQNCSETLLDTINHVLDYSKINSFEKKHNKSGNISNELVRTTNLALLCEDIIHGMMAANEFRDSGSQDISSPYTSQFKSRSSQLIVHKPHKTLEIIMDFEKRDWVYNVQAGALRRIVMNIFGNAQKYTDYGCIMIQLSMKNSKKGKDASSGVLCIRVRDTGRGMSSEYMERKLYHPFAQEDNFAPGVGLGLSIVWSIINQLGGEISIRSELGKGTDVDMAIPIEKSEKNQLQYEAADQHEVAISDAEEALAKLRDLGRGKSIHFNRQLTDRTRYKGILWQCIEKYCSEWFGFCITNSTADILITDLIENPQYPTSERILVIQEGMMGPSKSEKYSTTSIISTISQPIGPYKLARSLLALLNKEILDASNCGRRSSIANASTQTPVGSPAEQAIMDGIIIMDYGFPEANLPEKKMPDKALHKTHQHPVSEDVTPVISIVKSDNQNHEKSLDHIPNPSVLLPKNMLKLKQPPNKKYTNSDNSKALIVPEFQVKGNSPSISSHQSPKNTQLLPKSTPNSDGALTILAVDDNPVNLQLLKRYLLKRKCDTIVTARNGFEAVASFKEHGYFDVVFMDISMPEMSGFEATRLIRAYERSLQRESNENHLTDETNNAIKEVEDATELLKNHPNDQSNKSRRAYIVAVTGLASRRDREQAELCGLDDFLTKPISFAQIGVLLKKLCGDK